MTFDEAWNMLKPTMLRRAHKMYRVIAFSPVADRDDLISLAMLAVWEACLATDKPKDICRFAHRNFSYFVWRLAFDVSPLYYPVATTHFHEAVNTKSDSLDALMEQAGDFLAAPPSHDFTDIEVDALIKHTAQEEDEYQVARLRIVEGYKLVEVADILNMPIDKVRRTWDRFVRRARERW